MIARAGLILALAGSTCAAQGPGLRITSDDTHVVVGQDITWTVTVTDVLSIGLTGYMFAYDMSFLAADPTLADAQPFEDALSPLINPSPGTPIGGDIIGASGGQSSFFGVGNLILGNDIVLGSFTTEARREGVLTYSIEDGGNFTTETLKLSWTAPYFGPWPWNAPPIAVHSDAVVIVPAPATACLMLGLVALRRR